MAIEKQQRRLSPRTWHTAVMAAGLFGCDRCTGFVPSAHRLARISTNGRSVTSPSRPTCNMNRDSRNGPAARTPTASGSNSPLNKAAAALIATAAIISSSSIPADAALLGAYITDGGDGFHRHGAMTALVLSDESSNNENAVDFTGGANDSGAVDVGGLVSELKRGQDGKAVLSTMIKINKIVDADEEGVLENSSARENLVKGLIDKRRARGEAWDGDTEVAFGILKRKLDPFNVVLLRPYLKIAPFLGGLYYLAVFFVQQKFREFFPFAYFAAVAIFVAPAAILLVFN